MYESEASLDLRMTRAWRALGTIKNMSMQNSAVIRMHGQKWRRYHGYLYLRECFTELDLMSVTAVSAAKITLAICYRNAVNIPRRPHNEECSAFLFARHAEYSEIDESLVLDIFRYIIAARTGSIDRAKDADGALFCDIDLAILGSQPDKFAMYERCVAAEERITGIDPANRMEFYRQLVSPQAIYLTQAFAERYETTARANLGKMII